MKIGTIVILVVIVIGALVIGLMRTGVVGNGVPPEVRDRPMEVIDTESLEIIETTAWDFEQRYRVDPDTGYKIDREGRKVASPMTCISCGERIPPPPVPRDVEPEEHERMMMEHRCPICGDRAIEMDF